MDLILNQTTVKMPTLCLNMIVKNESKIITRLFDSVSKIIDCYCICDTGSTDDTVKIITEYFNNKNIPGKVVFEPFKNFCHNRTFALNACTGMSDFTLLLDADMILEVNNFDKNMLNQASYFNVLQGNDSFYYQNMRIVKNDGLCKYVGVTHEYIDLPQNSKVSAFEKGQIFIRDIGDGGCKSDKFERDIRLLLDGIQNEPNNVRYYFYLANSYHDLGRFGEAINTYKKRIEFGGWREEVWYSYYRIGLCYKKMDKLSDAFYYWLEGYEFYPERLEGLYEMLKHYRCNSKHKLGKTIYKMCREILDKNENRDQYLFLHNEVYISQIYYEYSIIAGYVGVKNINYEVMQVLNNSNVDGEINNLLSNLKFYKVILTQNSKYILDNSINSNINGEDMTLTSSSSCLIKTNDNNGINDNGINDNGYKLNVRYVNYHITDSGQYLNCDKNIITVNKYVEFDNNFNIIKEQFMEIDFDGRRYIGVEDVRIYHNVYNDKLMYIGTGYHKNNQIGIVSGEYDVDTKKLDVNELTQQFNNSGCEKNWIFVDYKNDNHIIYDWNPLKICKLENNNINIIETKKMPKIFSRVRGSTCGFNYIKVLGANNGINNNITINIEEKEIWFVGHIVSYENPRHYYHIIIVFDENMNLLRYSAPFKFEGEPIEYCLSIIVEDERVLINYSTWDRTTRIGVYEKNYIETLLCYKNL
jgi:tetratricopeptide (TPR) repeat protein